MLGGSGEPTPTFQRSKEGRIVCTRRDRFTVAIVAPESLFGALPVTIGVWTTTLGQQFASSILFTRINSMETVIPLSYSQRLGLRAWFIHI